MAILGPYQGQPGEQKNSGTLLGRVLCGEKRVRQRKDGLGKPFVRCMHHDVGVDIRLYSPVLCCRYFSIEKTFFFLNFVLFMILADCKRKTSRPKQ